MPDASDRIREHRDRQEKLEASAAEARTIVAGARRSRGHRDHHTYAEGMSEFLRASGLTERRAFIETFVKAIVVMPGKAVVRYTVPMPDDRRTPARVPRIWPSSARFCLPSSPAHCDPCHVTDDTLGG